MGFLILLLKMDLYCHSLGFTVEFLLENLNNFMHQALCIVYFVIAKGNCMGNKNIFMKTRAGRAGTFVHMPVGAEGDLVITVNALFERHLSDILISRRMPKDVRFLGMVFGNIRRHGLGTLIAERNFELIAVLGHFVE